MFELDLHFNKFEGYNHFGTNLNNNPVLPLFQFLVEEEDVLEDVVLEEMEETLC
ncbi:hypothetical protein DAPPUDRAFT_270411 [Daphnia pulex]|uniref:Uncharacterized protein n=1 Tax=Daphnia pulex TaxID=6669 RepID=E9I0N9_DAPPU|nr:hypothetical protein DAPPUDRAFT_270411 [Daphnia pulex]|eukprot:EFX62441.1 hypothetical protein DAPPUDRAFT_270411 [Daphnia pulex]